MTLEELQTQLNGLIHQTVTFTRIAGNSIIIYFFGEPGDDSVISVFIDPTWRYQKNGKIILGSYDLQIDEENFDSKEAYEERFNHLCSLTDGLWGAELVSCTIDPESSDITMEFSGGQVVRNFANSGFEDKRWTYRNLQKKLTAYVSPLGVRVATAIEESRAADLLRRLSAKRIRKNRES
jgi:hypothetical protein